MVLQFYEESFKVHEVLQKKNIYIYIKNIRSKIPLNPFKIQHKRKPTPTLQIRPIFNQMSESGLRNAISILKTLWKNKQNNNLTA